jgi:hypothetical protein
LFNRLKKVYLEAASYAARLNFETVYTMNRLNVFLVVETDFVRGRLKEFSQ